MIDVLESVELQLLLIPLTPNPLTQAPWTQAMSKVFEVEDKAPKDE